MITEAMYTPEHNFIVR